MLDYIKFAICINKRQNMLKEKYKNYDIEALPYTTYDKRWAVSVKISVENDNKIKEKIS